MLSNFSCSIDIPQKSPVFADFASGIATSLRNHNGKSFEGVGHHPVKCGSCYRNGMERAKIIGLYVVAVIFVIGAYALFFGGQYEVAVFLYSLSD